MRARIGLTAVLAVSAAFVYASAHQEARKVKCPGDDPHNDAPVFSGGEVVTHIKCGQKVMVVGTKGDYYHVRYANVEGDMHWSEFKGASPPGTAGLLRRAMRRQSRVAAAQAVARRAQAYARTVDPHIAWCDSHGGFDRRQVVNEPVYGTVTDNYGNQPKVTVPLTATYVVCKDGLRIQE
jgi:hypothetical protein